jgi:hypothetical protein
MEGVTTAIVAFIFVCVLFPRLVKNPTQYYTAFGLVILMLLFNSVARIFNSEKFTTFVGGLNGLLQLAALFLLVLSTGGLSLKDFAGEFKNAYEVMRRGESEKEVIVPLTGEMPKPRKPRPAATGPDEGRVVQPIETPPPPPPATGERRTGDSSSIPLE